MLKSHCILKSHFILKSHCILKSHDFGIHFVKKLIAPIGLYSALSAHKNARMSEEFNRRDYRRRGHLILRSVNFHACCVLLHE